MGVWRRTYTSAVQSRLVHSIQQLCNVSGQLPGGAQAARGIDSLDVWMQLQVVRTPSEKWRPVQFVSETASSMQMCGAVDTRHLSCNHHSSAPSSLVNTYSINTDTSYGAHYGVSARDRQPCCGWLAAVLSPRASVDVLAPWLP